MGTIKRSMPGETSAIADVPENAGDVDGDASGIETVTLYEEELTLKKQRASSGAVRIEKSVIEHEETVADTLTHTTAGIKKVPRDTIVVGDPPVIRQEKGVTIIPVLEERMVIRKELVLVEEVHVTMEVHTEPFEKTVTRRQDIVEITENTDF